MADAIPNHLGANTNVLYRFFDDKARLLYVGITNNPESRFRQHRQSQLWWNYVAVITLTRYGSRGELAAAEIAAIRGEKPKYNVTHADTGVVETIRNDKTDRKHARHIWGDANRFGNHQPAVVDTDDTPPALMMRMPCPECAMKAVYKEAVVDQERHCLVAADDLVRCGNCLNMWLDDEWRAATGLPKLHGAAS